MKRRGYQVAWVDHHKYITYTTPGGRKCRDIRLHQDKFRKENMEYEFAIREEILRQLGRRLSGEEQSIHGGDRTEALHAHGVRHPGPDVGVHDGDAENRLHLPAHLVQEAGTSG